MKVQSGIMVSSGITMQESGIMRYRVLVDTVRKEERREVKKEDTTYASLGRRQ